MPERNRLAPPTRFPGGCLGLDTHFQRLFSSSRTHQPPSTVDSYLIVPIFSWSFTTALAYEFILAAPRNVVGPVLDTKRFQRPFSIPLRSDAIARFLCDVRFDLIGRQLTIKDSRFHESGRVKRAGNNDSIKSRRKLRGVRRIFGFHRKLNWRMSFEDRSRLKHLSEKIIANGESESAKPKCPLSSTTNTSFQRNRIQLIERIFQSLKHWQVSLLRVRFQREKSYFISWVPIHSSKHYRDSWRLDVVKRWRSRVEGKSWQKLSPIERHR